jgi:hypothetical protein
MHRGAMRRDSGAALAQMPIWLLSFSVIVLYFVTAWVLRKGRVGAAWHTAETPTRSLNNL